MIINLVVPAELHYLKRQVKKLHTHVERLDANIPFPFMMRHISSHLGQKAQGSPILSHHGAETTD